MKVVNICVGSSCYIKGSEKIVELFKAGLDKYKLSDEVILTGNFCTGKCNREGVTITIDEVIFTGVTPENFHIFFKDKILQAFNL